jgi:hypothetical protein
VVVQNLTSPPRFSRSRIASARLNGALKLDIGRGIEIDDEPSGFACSLIFSFHATAPRVMRFKLAPGMQLQ